MEGEVSADVGFYKKCLRFIKKDDYEELFTLLAEKMSRDQKRDEEITNTNIRDSRKEQQFLLFVILQFSKKRLENNVVPVGQSSTLLHCCCQYGAVNIISKLLVMLSLLKESQYNIIHPLYHDEIQQSIETNVNQNIKTKMKGSKEVETEIIQDMQNLTPYDILLKFIVGCQDSEGNLPFHLLAKSTDPRCTEILGQFFKEMNSYNDFDHRDNKLRDTSKLKHNYFNNDHHKYINMQNMNGLTPLHLACIYGCLSNVTLLLQEGANRWSKVKMKSNIGSSSSREGMNCLHLAVLHAPSSSPNLKDVEERLNDTDTWSKNMDLIEDVLPIPFVDKEWSSPFHYIIDHLVSKSDFNNSHHVSNISFTESPIKKQQNILMEGNDHSNVNNRQPSFSSYSLAEVEFFEGSSSSLSSQVRMQSFIDSQNQRGQTSLHLAALTGNTDLLKILLYKYKANSTVTDYLTGSSPLHYALLRLEIETNKDSCQIYDSVSSNVKLLVENNLDLVWQCDKHGIYPLHLACYYRHEYLINTFVNIIMQAGPRRLSLSSMVDNNNLNVLHYLFKRGTSVFNLKFQTSIDIIFRICCDAPITSLQPTEENESTMAIRSAFPLLQLFVEKIKIDVNKQDKYGFSALHYICNSANITDNITTLTYLLIKGANTESRSFTFGLTPLHIACITGNTSKTAALVNQGARIDIETFSFYEENSAISQDINESELIKQCEHEELDELNHLHPFKGINGPFFNNSLISKSQVASLLTDTANFWIQFLRNFRIPTLSEIIFGKAGQSFSSDGSFTPLHLSCIFGNLDTAEYLIFKGAAIDAKTYNYQSPLHVSVLFRKVDCVCMLLHRNAKISHVFPMSWNLHSFFHHPMFASFFWKLEDLFPLHLLIQEDPTETFLGKHNTSVKACKQLNWKDYLGSQNNVAVDQYLCNWLMFGQKGTILDNTEQWKALNSKQDVTAAGNLSYDCENKGIQPTHRRKGRKRYLREKYHHYRSNMSRISFPCMKYIQANVGSLSKIFFIDCHIISILLSNQLLRSKQRIGRYIFESFGNMNIMMTIYINTLNRAVNRYLNTSYTSMS